MHFEDGTACTSPFLADSAARFDGGLAQVGPTSGALGPPQPAKHRPVPPCTSSARSHQPGPKRLYPLRDQFSTSTIRVSGLANAPPGGACNSLHDVPLTFRDAVPAPFEEWTTGCLPRLFSISKRLNITLRFASPFSLVATPINLSTSGTALKTLTKPRRERRLCSRG